MKHIFVEFISIDMVATVTHTQPRYIIVVCPLCRVGKKERFSKSRLTLYRLQGLEYGVDIDEIVGNSVYVYLPCDHHKEQVKKIVSEKLAVWRDAKSNYESMLKEELERIGRRVIEKALQLGKDLLGSIGVGEAVVLWVCDGSKDKDVVREVFAVIVNEDGNPKIVAGGIARDKIAYKSGSPYADTHYVTQHTLAILSRYRDLRWKAYIQGRVIEGRDNIYNLMYAIFMDTHTRPKDTLVDFLRSPPQTWREPDPRTIIYNSPIVDEEMWSIADPEPIANRIAGTVMQMYGLDPRRRPKMWEIFNIRTGYAMRSTTPTNQ